MELGVPGNVFGREKGLVFFGGERVDPPELAYDFAVKLAEPAEEAAVWFAAFELVDVGFHLVETGLHVHARTCWALQRRLLTCLA